MVAQFNSLSQSFVGMQHVWALTRQDLQLTIFFSVSTERMAQ